MKLANKFAVTNEASQGLGLAICAPIRPGWRECFVCAPGH